MWYDGGDKKVVKRKRKGQTLAQNKHSYRSLATALESLLGNLMHTGKDLQAHGYGCSFHLGVFQGTDFHGEREVC
jgi:hypothetical protein